MCLNLWTVFLSFPNVLSAAFIFGLSPVLTRLTTFVMSRQACSGVLTKVNKTMMLRNFHNMFIYTNNSKSHDYL